MNAIFFSVILGAVAVLQGGLNRQLMSKWGLANAILINNAVVLLLSALFWIVLLKFANVSNELSPKISGFKWQWWVLFPGICGFLFVAGLPITIAKIGALRVFLSVVVGQMIFSLIWDNLVEGLSSDPRRLIGAGLAIAGLVVASASGK